MARVEGRGATWIFWVLSTITSVLFIIISLVTFVDLAQVQYESTAGDPGSQINGSMAATLMAPVLSSVLLVVSFFVLIKKSWSRDGTGFSYGLISASYLLMCMFLLLTGVVLSSDYHWTHDFAASPYWSSSDTNAFVATEVLAYITAGFYLVMAAVLLATRKSFQGGGRMTVDELGMSDRLRNPGTPMSSAVGSAGAPAPPPPYSEAVAAGRSGGAASGAWNVP